jgi:hypothetical protein
VFFENHHRQNQPLAGTIRLPLKKPEVIKKNLYAKSIGDAFSNENQKKKL